MSGISLEEFADKINQIIPVIWRGLTQQQENELFKGKVTLSQFMVLAFISSSGELMMKDLAKFMKVTTANMTGLIERLVRDGYVERVYQPEDRRVIKVKLNSKGNELVKKISKQRRDMIINMFGKVSETDRQDYLKILTKIRYALIKEQEPHS